MRFPETGIISRGITVFLPIQTYYMNQLFKQLNIVAIICYVVRFDLLCIELHVLHWLKIYYQEIAFRARISSI